MPDAIAVGEVMGVVIVGVVVVIINVTSKANPTLIRAL